MARSAREATSASPAARRRARRRRAHGPAGIGLGQQHSVMGAAAGSAAARVRGQVGTDRPLSGPPASDGDPARLDHPAARRQAAAEAGRAGGQVGHGEATQLVGGDLAVPGRGPHLDLGRLGRHQLADAGGAGARLGVISTSTLTSPASKVTSRTVSPLRTPARPASSSSESKVSSASSASTRRQAKLPLAAKDDVVRHRVGAVRAKAPQLLEQPLLPRFWALTSGAGHVPASCTNRARRRALQIPAISTSRCSRSRQRARVGPMLPIGMPRASATSS